MKRFSAALPTTMSGPALGKRRIATTGDYLSFNYVDNPGRIADERKMATFGKNPEVPANGGRL